MSHPLGCSAQKFKRLGNGRLQQNKSICQIKQQFEWFWLYNSYICFSYLKAIKISSSLYLCCTYLSNPKINSFKQHWDYFLSLFKMGIYTPQALGYHDASEKEDHICHSRKTLETVQNSLEGRKWKYFWGLLENNLHIERMLLNKG